MKIRPVDWFLGFGGMILLSAIVIVCAGTQQAIIISDGKLPRPETTNDAAFMIIEGAVQKAQEPNTHNFAGVFLFSMSATLAGGGALVLLSLAITARRETENPRQTKWCSDVPVELRRVWDVEKQDYVPLRK